MPSPLEQRIDEGPRWVPSVYQPSWIRVFTRARGVKRLRGNSPPAITLKVYADEFAADHAERTRALLDAAVGNVLETTGGEQRRTEVEPEGPKVAQLAVIDH